MNLSQIMQQINANVYLNANTPITGSNDYNLYLALSNTVGINTWENEQNTLWNELWVMDPPTFTITVGTTVFDLPSDFKFIGGGVLNLALLGSTATNPSIQPIPVKMLAEKVLNSTGTAKECYISGNSVNGYTITLGWTPKTGDVEIGGVVSYYYYKHTLLNQVEVYMTSF